MSGQESFEHDAHTEASNRVLSTLQETLNDGVIPNGGMVASYITIVETIDNDGNSKVQVLWSDNRMTILLGLLQWGQMSVSAGMGGGN